MFLLFAVPFYELIESVGVEVFFSDLKLMAVMFSHALDAYDEIVLTPVLQTDELGPSIMLLAKLNIIYKQFQSQMVFIGIDIAAIGHFVISSWLCN